ncbi:MAG: VOC family protein, partial [Pseudomonadota bacterium]|nr:VOC family protein [Pseudomonadota bacterium]
MSLVLDHINLRTQDLGRMVEWYGRVLGLTPQARPAFAFDGAWLGDGVGAPAVHVVAVDDPPIAYAADQQLE